MKQVIVFPRGTLDAKDRKRLTAAGVVAIESDDPSKIVMLTPCAPSMTSDDLLSAAIETLSGLGGSHYREHVQAEFAEALFRRVQSRSSNTPEQARAGSASPGSSGCAGGAE